MRTDTEIKEFKANMKQASIYFLLGLYSKLDKVHDFEGMELISAEIINRIERR